MLDGLPHPGFQLVDERGRVGQSTLLARVGEIQVPVELPIDPAVPHPQEVARRDRLDALEEGARGPGAERVEEQVDAHRVRPRRDQPRGEQRPDLRAPEQPAVGHRVIERADAHAVAAQDQRARVPVPDRDGVLAPRLFEDRLAVILVEVGPQLGIAARGQAMPARDQLGLQLGVFEHLPVLRDPHGAVFIADRLAASGQVDDRQPPRAHRQARLEVDLLVVRPAMGDAPVIASSRAAENSRRPVRSIAPAMPHISKPFPRNPFGRLATPLLAAGRGRSGDD